MNCKKCASNKNLRPLKNNYYCKRCYKEEKAKNSLSYNDYFLKEIEEMLKE